MKIRYTLEMTSPDQFRPKSSSVGELAIVRAEVPLPELNRWL
ncbi:MAG: GNAT family N-acetyltransferase, partial [Chloroflexi bacterium]|nr:GNAT family N-acetyltransferase [Chloroflexota bacterium]